ncbi:hypothetical protein ACIPY1_17645 [Paenarthrobacter nicotinovorans]|uniref:hypothetical protein n=1 Tax=Paenarthrobacter nicotinovorans TaxID=29320 RepID=UPI003818EEC8
MKKLTLSPVARPGAADTQAAEPTAVKRRIRTLEQEVEVRRGAEAYISQAPLPG